MRETILHAGPGTNHPKQPVLNRNTKKDHHDSRMPVFIARQEKPWENGYVLKSYVAASRSGGIPTRANDKLRSKSPSLKV